MTYRVQRKFISSTFKVNGQLCKVFLEPLYQASNKFWTWNVGFAIGKSNRQLNDWYWRRKNKRARSLNKKLTGCQGIKTISLGFKEVLKLRWHIAPGDALLLDCTSAEPKKQFKAWQYFCRNRPEWYVDHEKKEFYWTKPPYPIDPVWKQGIIIPRIPDDPLANTHSELYDQCFDLKLKA